MYPSIAKLALAAGLALAAAWAATAAAQGIVTRQTLDRVDVHNRTNVLDMEFEDPANPSAFSVFPIAPVVGFGPCAHTALQGIYCLDGTVVRHWQEPEEPEQVTGTGEFVFSCLDPALALRTEGCTAMTVGLSEAIWSVGRRQGTGFSLIKLLPKNGTCPTGTVSLQQASYCARASIVARPPADLTVLDGDTGDKFVGPGGVTGPGVLGIEDGTSVVFYRDAPTTVRTLIADRSRLILSGNETVQSVTLLQLSIEGVTRNFVLATTTKHRILAVDTVGSLAAFQVFDIATQRSPSSLRCNTLVQKYGLRASNESGRVYLTDRNFCEVVALEVPSPGVPFALENVQGNSDLTISTAPFAPDEPMIAPGIDVDLTTCAGTCTFLSAPNGDPAASLSNVTLASDESNMVVFQITDFPDCRWIQPLPTACQAPDVIVNPGDPPSLQFLNVTPLLPQLFTLALPTPLPRLLIHPQYRAQSERGFTFDAFFTVPEPGVVFTDTFDGLFDIGLLTGNQLGCGFDLPPVAPQPNLAWDVVTRVSEIWVAVGFPGSLSTPNSPNRHADTLMNTGCFNPTRIKGPGLSLIPYNLEITPTTDAVLGHLLAKLLDDFKATLDELACIQRDTVGAPPLAAGVCATLAQQWANAKDKFDKCFAASLKPKSSSGSQNCTSFQSQLDGLGSTLDAIQTSTGPDPANRLGDLKARHAVVQHVFDRFLDSIPSQGFTNLPL